MEANYKKLWKLLIDKDMKKTDLLTLAGINSNILAKMGRGDGVSMDTAFKKSAEPWIAMSVTLWN